MTRITTHDLPAHWASALINGDSKRALDGTHHHISKAHAGLYFSELDYKYNTRKVSDGKRTALGIQQMTGKRLMLRRPKNNISE